MPPSPLCVRSSAVVTKGKDPEASSPSTGNARLQPARVCSAASLPLSVLRRVRMHVRTSEATGGARGVSRGEQLWNMESGRVALPVTPVL